jgi:hypothetical protein
MISGGRDWRSVIVSAFTCYFDASGTEHDQPCLSVAGYMATADRWIEFETLWKNRLAIDGIADFHAKEVSQKFKDQPHKKSKLYEDLIEVIRQYANRQFGCVVENEGLRALSNSDRKTWHVNAYSIAGRACAAQVRGWFNSWNARSLPMLVFEKGDTGQDALRKLLEKEGFICSFVPKRDCIINGFLQHGAVPLQAADLLASELFNPIRDIARDGHLKRIKPQYLALMQIPGRPTVILPEHFQQVMKFGVKPMDEKELWVPDGLEDVPYGIRGEV